MERIYKAKESKTIWTVLIIIATFNIFFLDHRLAFFPYLFLVLLILALFVNYELRISDDRIQFKINLFSLTVVTREAMADNIKEMYFMNLAGKVSVLVMMHKGFRLKLAKFEPTDFDRDLLTFATNHGIKVNKLNGYE
ncbi:hypothetical protein [Desertibacillus haloalkaliphilus]|uniref:hypothetical protein n=1 Tax=Desertibacillus haloalkaliphilus TaxID=1328930 RepID=UPI001C27C56D|nr:hypothetical protein [Desertibacillus haloalkaliphilus]MBU8905362.1 hypothetical protein [Desertibacillus haloalkaliphilus]